jgi:hypothetical protein
VTSRWTMPMRGRNRERLDAGAPRSRDSCAAATARASRAPRRCSTSRIVPSLHHLALRLRFHGGRGATPEHARRSAQEDELGAFPANS